MINLISNVQYPCRGWYSAIISNYNFSDHQLNIFSVVLVWPLLVIVWLVSQTFSLVIV